MLCHRKDRDAKTSLSSRHPRTHLCILLCKSSFFIKCKVQNVLSRPSRDTFTTTRTTISFFACLMYTHMQIVFKWLPITSYCLLSIRATTKLSSDSPPPGQCREDKKDRRVLLNGFNNPQKLEGDSTINMKSVRRKTY